MKMHTDTSVLHTEEIQELQIYVLDSYVQPYFEDRLTNKNYTEITETGRSFSNFFMTIRSSLFQDFEKSVYLSSVFS